MVALWQSYWRGQKADKILDDCVMTILMCIVYWKEDRYVWGYSGLGSYRNGIDFNNPHIWYWCTGCAYIFL